MNKNLRALHTYLRTLGTKTNAVLFGSSVALASPAAFAADGIDTATILAAITGMVAAGVIIYTAFAVGRWTMKAFGLIGGK